jgi:hypothetical protein
MSALPSAPPVVDVDAYRLAGEDLILGCLAARLHGDPAVVRAMPTRGRPHWDEVLETAREHSVAALVAASLSEFAPDLVPLPALHRLRAQMAATAAANLRRSDELVRVLGLLSARGIRALPFKGPLLGTALHGTPCLREFADLDILVAPSDITAALTALACDGYKPGPDTGGTLDVQRLRTKCEVMLVGPDGYATFELHSALAPKPFRLDLRFEDVWSRSERLVFRGVSVPSLAVADLFLFLSVHGTKHRWRSLRWIYDIAELVRNRSDLDWPGLLAASQRLRCRRILILSVVLACELFRLEVPEPIRTFAARDRRIYPLVARTRAIAFAAEPPGYFEKLAFSLAVRDRWRHRLAVWLHYIADRMRWNAADVEVVKLPQKLSFLYYVVRPMRLLRVYGPGPVGRAVQSLANPYRGAK